MPAGRLEVGQRLFGARRRGGGGGCSARGARAPAACSPAVESGTETSDGATEQSAGEWPKVVLTPPPTVG
ncbi:MAG: hypothetical protein IPK66_17345 [Rhodospirillales bacterium]|nr:hypothetical protein [Rhodospirillales bacterium]